MSDLLTSFNEQALWIQSLIGLVLLALAALAVNFLLKKVILRAASPFLDKETDTSDKAAAWLATVVPLLIVSRGIDFVPHLPETVRQVVANVAQGLIVLSIAMAIVKALTYVNEVYERRPISKNRPIKGYLQVLKIVVLCGPYWRVSAHPAVGSWGDGCGCAARLQGHDPEPGCERAAIFERHASGGRLDPDAEHECRWRCDRHRAAHGEGPEFRQDDHHHPDPPPDL
jgi:hypothetical protein